jgi:predicted O-linked N-acetylglucosamine transferase (SPINDLY family)
MIQLPDSAEIPYNLGIALWRQGKLAESLASYRRALHLKPDHAEAHHNLGVALKQQGQLADAAASLQQALRLKPDYADAHLNLGNVFRAQGRLDDAIAAYRAALQLKPNFAEAQSNLGNVLKDQGLVDDAIAAYRTCLGLKPDAADMHSNLVFILPFHPGYDSEAILQECWRWNQQHAEPLTRLIQPHNNHRDPDRRLRIGYVSPDFRDHVQSFFTIPLLSHHDHRECEIFCYANILRPDALTERLRGYADVWRNTVGLSDQQVADLVRGDRIDVLVDLAMHMANSRLLVFARKPAPIQVAWLAYPGTTGLSSMDYRLTDPYLDPPGLFDAFYSEESIRLPNTFWCYDPLTDHPSVNALPAIENGVVTFGCLNNFCKINDGCLALWAKALEAVPQSRLLLLAPRGQPREHVLARLQHKGIASGRVEFTDKQPRLDYLKLYHRIDLGVDPVPYNGHTTSLDAFWMGVPTITLVSMKTAFGRAGWSQLCNLGLKELAAETPEQYVALAAKLAADLPRLQELRATLRQRMQRSPLMDANHFARHMEQAYRQMWRRWCEQKKPETVSKAIASDGATAGQGNVTARIAVSQLLDTAWKHFQAGHTQKAEQCYLLVLQASPNQVDALQLLGVIAGQTGRNDLAIDYLNTALRLNPDLAAAHNNLGNVFVKQQKLPEAVASFRQAVRLRPDHAEAHFNLGLALIGQGKPAAAEASLLRASQLKPDSAEAHFQMGLALGKQGKHGAAADSNQQALRLKPDYAEAHFNLGSAFVNQGKLDEAVASYQQAVRHKSNYVDAYYRLGHILRDQGRLDDSIAAFRTAIQLQPDDPRFLSALIMVLNLHPDFDMRALHEECLRWNQQHAEPLKIFILPHANLPDPDRRLRIGYVSPDFREHVDAFFTFPLLSNHDHRQFELFCYANVACPDALTERLRGLADIWRTTVGLADQQVAELIRSDRIDILIDLELHSAPDQLRIFARKPAPVQATWLGYPGTTGLSAIDYRVTDPYLDPAGLFDPFYTEESVRLPDTFWCYDPLTDQPPVNALPAVKNGYITFGCLNNFSKVNDGLLSLWAQVLHTVPGSCLLLLAPPGKAREHVLASLQQEGIAAARAGFADKRQRSEYLKYYHGIDIGLDPVPCNGHTTSLDAFWMGVPTITLVSTETTFGRAGWSQLSNLGLQDLAAETPQQYVALAAQLAADLPRLQELRGTLRQRMQRSPLMDGKRFARNMEQAYRKMWRSWCQQTKPAEVRKAISPQLPTSSQGKEIGGIAISKALDTAWKHCQAGQLQEAEQFYLQILQVDPNHVDALHSLGVIAGQTGRNDLAVDYLQAVLRFKPDFAAAHNNLGNVLFQQGKFPEAVASYRQALRIKPDYAEAHNNLGHALQEGGQFADAEASLGQALHLKPDYAEASHNLAIALAKQGRLEEAEAANQHALRLKPDFTDARVSLGNLLKDQGRLDDASAAYRAALQLKPDAAHIHSNLLLVLHYHPGFDAQAIYQEFRRWNQQHAEPLKKLILAHTNLPDPQRRLRIGYVSPDFREHVDSFFTVPLLANHDHRLFEIFCYANVSCPDALTERLRGFADVWRSTVELSDQQVADMIRNDQIDILVDLEMHMANNRLLVFARKPAPVQVAWLACPGTTGLSTMDYRLTDPYLDPVGLFDAFYSEESIRLPDTFWCYDPLTDLPQVNALPALKNGVVTFGSLNNFCKVNDGCLALWAEVLQAVPQSRLLLLAPRGRAQEHVLARLEQEGLAASRVEFADRQPRLEYLKLYHQVDLCLDPVPCGGHTTSLDAFWMGVPTITLVSTKTAFGRAGWSQLCNLGLKELAAETPERYVALAAQLAGDLSRLQELRATLRQRMLQSPLMDGKRFARHMELAYRQMWRRWCKERRIPCPSPVQH